MKAVIEKVINLFKPKQKPRTFITADLHLFHTGIMKHTKRKFKDVQCMNEHIRKVWNQTVNPNDEVIIVGDVAFTNNKPTKKKIQEAIDFINTLNGEKVLIRGNHDGSDFIEACKKNNIEVFTRQTYIGKKGKAELIHDPKHAIGNVNGYAYILHGHLHGNKSYETETNPNVTYIDVGWDVFNKPILLNKLIN